MSADIAEFRAVLGLDRKPYSAIPDEYFSILFPPMENKYKSFFESQGFYLKGPSKPIRLLEWVGDSILELTVRIRLVEYGGDYRLDFLDNVRRSVVKNTNLHCFLIQKKICGESDSYTKIKECANIVEVLMGIIFYFFDRNRTEEEGSEDPVGLAMYWFYTTFDIPTEIDERLRGKATMCSKR